MLADGPSAKGSVSVWKRQAPPPESSREMARAVCNAAGSRASIP